MDENLLIKMFEIRINNQRTFLFAFLAFFITLTTTIAFNQDAYNYFNEKNIISISVAKILIALSIVEIGIIVYLTFGLDRAVLKELEILLNAKEKLIQLKKANLTSEENVEPKKQGEKADIADKVQT